MMPPPDPRLVAAWIAMADHFLDTETRQDIPLTALRCVEAGLSPERARYVWQHEVSPVVRHNLFDIAGEWAMWPTDWLLPRIEAVREKNNGPLGTARALLRPLHMKEVWTTIERCLALLSDTPPDEREPLARRLAFLAQHAFDFLPKPLHEENADEQRQLRALYPEPALTLLAPAWLSDERGPGEARLRKLFA